MNDGSKPKTSEESKITNAGGKTVKSKVISEWRKVISRAWN
jgi:hypothetical protein